MNQAPSFHTSTHRQDTPSRWHAAIQLGLEKTPRGTLIKRCRQQGPLYVQKAFYPEGRALAHAYLLHPPGGMVSGDELKISVNLGERAQALITTPGAGRIYRARADSTPQTQRVSLTLAPYSSLEWLPLENILFSGAQAQLNTDVTLAENSHIILWDISCFGLPAKCQAFASGGVSQRLQIFAHGSLKLREKFQLNPDNKRLMHTTAGLKGQPVCGLLLAGPFTQDADPKLLKALHGACSQCPALASVSQNGWFLQVRYLGTCPEQAKALFIDCWQHIRPELLHRPSCKPRIWAT